jgi:hypothetical protein
MNSFDQHSRTSFPLWETFLRQGNARAWAGVGVVKPAMEIPVRALSVGFQFAVAPGTATGGRFTADFRTAGVG